MAAEVSVSPSVRVSEEYDDNVLISTTNKVGDFVTTLVPTLNLNLETERAKINPRAEIGAFKYVDQTNLDRVDQRYGLGGLYGLTERTQVTGDFSYAKENALYSVLAQTGEVTRTTAARDRRGYATGFSYVLTPRSDLGMNWNRQEIRYGSDAPASFVDYDNDSFTGTYQYKLATGLDSIAVQPSYTRFDANVSNSNSLGLSLGWIHSLHELLDLRLFAGARRTESEFTFTRTTLEPVFPPFIYRVVQTKETEKNSNWGWLADMSLNYKGENNTASLGYTRNLDFSVTGDPLEVDRFSLSLTRVLGPRLSATMYTSLLFSKSNGKFTNIDNESYNLSPSLSYRLTENHSLAFSYAFSRYVNKATTVEQTYDRNRVWLTLTLLFPKKWARGI